MRIVLTLVLIAMLVGGLSFSIYFGDWGSAALFAVAIAAECLMISN